HVEGVTEFWDGPLRPGHFDGVATVVAKIFNIVRPDVAVFGRKDLQQCAVVQALVKDLNFPVRVELSDTIREPDGLAMSSRNAYLSAEDRAVAPQLNIALTRASHQIRAGKRVEDVLEECRSALERLGF